MATYWENSCSFGLRYVTWYKYLIVGLVFSHLGFWSGNLFLIAPFPDLCLLVPFSSLSQEQAIQFSEKSRNKSLIPFVVEYNASLPNIGLILNKYLDLLKKYVHEYRPILAFKDLYVVTVYTCLKIYLYKKHCLFLSTMLHSLACFIMWLLNMLQMHGFVYT